MLRWSSGAALALVLLAGCASTVERPGGRGRVVDPRTQAGRLQCLRAHRLPATEVGATSLQVGPLPSGPTIRFEPTSGAAEGDQARGAAQGAEAIGSALLYPNGAPDAELKVIENCVAQGVRG
jgi:hypothetical protein